MNSAYGQIREGMDVLDLAGDKIGTVARVAGQETIDDVGEGGEGVGRAMEAKRAGKGASGYIEVRRPGHDLYIPFSAVNQIRENAVSIIVAREAVDTQGWDRAPRTA
jgi:hypothetical protein